MNTYNIETISYGVLGSADKITVNVMAFNLGEIPKVQVQIMSDSVLENKTLEMPQSIYQSWGTDDSVIINWVCDELGLTLA